MIKIINLIIYFLRYISIIKTKYKVYPEIDFGSKKSNNFFLRNLKKCKFYLEYGSGNSTIVAKKLNKMFVSIESDKSFFNYLKYNKKIHQIEFVNIGPTKYFSYPILPIFLIKKKIRNYSNYIIKISTIKKKIPDLILLDGRFRMHTLICILNYLLSNKINQRLTIIIDDFVGRKNYKIAEKITKVKIVGRFGVINYNNYKILSKDKIKKYLQVSIKDYL